MADGTEYDLPVVLLAPSGVATIEINTALAAAPAELAGHISDYGSATLRYNAVTSAILAQTAIGSTTVSESFLSLFHAVQPGSPGTQTLEGLWWARDAGIGGFISLSNAADQPRTVSIRALSASGQTLPARSLTLGPHASEMLDLLSLIGQRSKAGDAGGIRIEFEGLLGEVNVTGGLENRSEGYSAIIPFWESPMARMSMSETAATIAHPGVMVGAADPMMGFPVGTRFTPYLALRNLTESAQQVRLTLYTEQGTALAAPSQQLQPFESRQVDLASILQQIGLKDFNGSLTLTVSHSGSASDVMSAAGSVDASGTYVFEVDGRAAEQKLSKQSPYWSVKNGNDTMVALWNSTGSAEDVMVTMKYAGGSGVYHFRVHLAPYATANLDLKELIANRSPDQDGNMLPLDVQEGSFVFHNAKDVHAPLSLNVNVGVFNVAKGTCYWGTVDCDGYYGNLILSPSTSSIAAYGDWVEQIVAYGQYSDGSTPEVSASWSSSNSSIASVDSNGNVTGGNNAGNVTITATANLPEEGEYYGYNPSCESLQPYINFSGSATVSVGDQTPVITSVDPSVWHPGTTTTVIFQGEFFGTWTPTFSFSPSSGISYALQADNDNYIRASITVAAGTPNEDVTVTLTSSGYSSQGFQGNGNGQSSQGKTTVTVRAPINSPEITAVGWIDANTITLPTGENSQLQANLNNPPICAADVIAWSKGFRNDLSNTTTDPAYAAAFLLKNSGNSAPPSTIYPPGFAATLTNYRLFNDYGGAGGPVGIGRTPNPCVPSPVSNWTSVAASPNPVSGQTGFSATGQIYQIAEGRLGEMGQAVNMTLFGHSVPWIWSVIEFNAATGAPNYQNHSIFPSFYFYSNGTLTSTYSPTPANAQTFINSNNSYQLPLPVNP